MTFKLNNRKYRISLRLAVVATITEERGEFTPVSTDIAVCNPVDFFAPATGAKKAVERALKRAFSKLERTEIWPQIRSKIAKKGEKVFEDAVTDIRVANINRRY